MVGSLSGLPLQVSGPAAGLIVLVLRDRPAVRPRVTRPGRACSPADSVRRGPYEARPVVPSRFAAVIKGMLAGIGVLIFASQFHVMLDDKPPVPASELLGMPTSLINASTYGGPHLRRSIGFPPSRPSSFGASSPRRAGDCFPLLWSAPLWAPLAALFSASPNQVRDGEGQFLAEAIFPTAYHCGASPNGRCSSAPPLSPSSPARIAIERHGRRSMHRAAYEL